MRRHYPVIALLLVAALPAAALAAAAARQGAAARTSIGQIVVETRSLEGALQGPWTATNGVTITAGGTTLTADTVKIWPVKGRRDIQRIEATGNVHVTGTYTMAQRGGAKTDWQISATSQTASYDGASRTGVMSGNVDLKATNVSTGEVVTAQADKAVYDGKTQRFRFERSAQPVRLEWQESKAKAGGK